MENNGTGIGRIDSYEDMFKEITRKLYGEDPDHRTSSVQNEFEAPVSFKSEEDADEGTNCSDDIKWTLDDEPLKGTEGSRIAAYCAATSTWRCYECGASTAGGSREAAHHFYDAHSARLQVDESERERLAHTRKNMLGLYELKMQIITTYLDKVKEQAESMPPPRRSQETQTTPATLLPVATPFLLHELPSPAPQPLLQNSTTPMPANAAAPTAGSGSGSSAAGNTSAAVAATTAVASTSSAATAAVGGGGGGGGAGGGGGNNGSGKRYTCLYCPYGTDRRDLYTRHENIHREEKPFHCYVCYKPFSRADHVKKHFLRMHREQTYEMSRIRKSLGPSSSAARSQAQLQPSEASSTASTSGNSSSLPYTSVTVYSNPKQQQQPQQPQPQQPIQPVLNTTTYQLQSPTPSSVHSASAALYQAASLSSVAVVAAAAAAANVTSIMQQQQQQQQQLPDAAAVVRKIQNGACGTKSQGKAVGSGSRNQERRYTCCYCSWSGVDNWCLKRHLNTHLKPFACALCEYKAARAERLATHVLKVHNRRQCSRCSYLADDLTSLQVHQLHVHRISNPTTAAAVAQQQQQLQQQAQVADRQQQQTQPILPAAGGRPPPGPPVFPASSAAIAPATTVISPTTILGRLPTMVPLIYGHEQRPRHAEQYQERFVEHHQEASKSEEHFQGRRSRKQSKPRRCENSISSPVMEGLDAEEEAIDQPAPIDAKGPGKKIRRLYKCLLCEKRSAAARFRYHSKRSLMLHRIWRHSRETARRTKVTLRATIKIVKATHVALRVNGVSSKRKVRET